MSRREERGRRHPHQPADAQPQRDDGHQHRQPEAERETQRRGVRPQDVRDLRRATGRAARSAAAGCTRRRAPDPTSRADHRDDQPFRQEQPLDVPHRDIRPRAAGRPPSPRRSSVSRNSKPTSMSAAAMRKKLNPRNSPPKSVPPRLAVRSRSRTASNTSPADCRIEVLQQRRPELLGGLFERVLPGRGDANGRDRPVPAAEQLLAGGEVDVGHRRGLVGC